MSLVSGLVGSGTGSVDKAILASPVISGLKNKFDNILNAVANADQKIQNAQQTIISNITGVVDQKIQTALGTSSGNTQEEYDEYGDEEYGDEYDDEYGDEYGDEEYEEGDEEYEEGDEEYEEGDEEYEEGDEEYEEGDEEYEEEMEGGGGNSIQYTGTLPTAQSGGGSHENVYLDKPYSGQIYVTEVNGDQLYFIKSPTGQFRPLNTYTASSTARTRISARRAKAKKTYHRAARKPRAHSTRKRKQPKKALTRRR
jgi:hypothetical protein